MKLNVYIGFDSSNYGQELAYEVCKRSIEKNTRHDITIHKLVKSDLVNRNIFTRNDTDGSTEFTYTRFLVPYLNNYEGYALFCDSDFLWECDINELFENFSNPKYALACVKHTYSKCKCPNKMDNKVQEWYPRKNWSSLMLFNCSHSSTRNLSLENVNNKSAKWLHRMEWCKDYKILEIPKSYNYLVGYYDDEHIKALHFTDGGPWYPKYKNVLYADRWIKYLNNEEKNKISIDM